MSIYKYVPPNYSLPFSENNIEHETDTSKDQSKSGHYIVYHLKTKIIRVNSFHYKPIIRYTIWNKVCGEKYPHDWVFLHVISVDYLIIIVKLF